MMLCQPTDAVSLIYCVFLHGSGYNYVFLGLLLFFVLALIFWRWHLKLSVVLPATLIATFILAGSQIKQPEYETFLFILTAVAGGLIGLFFFRIIKF